MTHTCSYVYLDEGENGVRKICPLCCEEEIRLAQRQREYDFYGTEPLWEEVDDE